MRVTSDDRETATMNGDDNASETANDISHETASAPAETTGDEQEITLTFSYEPQGTLDDLFGISEETLFHAFDLALARVGVTESVEVSVLITTDEGIRTLNREYRGRDEATDVLSFPLLDQPLVEAPADQLWQPPDAEIAEAEDGEPAPHSFYPSDAPDAGEDDFADDFADDENGDQSLKGMIVIMGDDEDGFADEPDTWPTHLGDIAISRETTLRQAQQAGHSAAYEVAFLFVHGVLHLVGFDDHTDAGYQAMVAHQEAALAQAGVTRS